MDNKPANIYQEDSGRASINSLSTRKKLPIKIVSFVIVFLILALLVEVIFYLNDRTKKASIREKSETLLNENDSVTNNFITDLSQDSKDVFFQSIHVGIPIQINLLIKGTDDYIINTATIFNESSK